MADDDRTTGRVLSRREVLAMIGSSGAAFVAAKAGAQAGSAGRGPAAGACVATPEQTEGPYFVDERLERVDLRSDPADGSVREGTPLALVLRVSSIGPGGCAPLAGALVDVWHCDARGVYSDVRDPGFDTTGKKFLRGYQRTDAAGVARFTTIYPGGYRGRAVHIHFKVRVGGASGPAREFTSQLYFDDAINDRVLSRPPYAGSRGLRNDQDGLFRRGGRQLVVPLREDGGGFVGEFDVGLRA